MRIKHNLTLTGPNWRSDRTVIELHFGVEGSDRTALRQTRHTLPGQLRAGLRHAGVETNDEHYAKLPEDELECFAQLFCLAAIALQRNANHHVQWLHVIADTDRTQCIALFEYEHRNVGQEACRIARRLIAGLCPGLSFAGPENDRAVSLEEDIVQFRSLASDLALPIDASAIIAAAVRRDIPVKRLDRWPYQPMEGDFRIRRNGMLKLGHCGHQLIIDGSFCTDRSAAARPLVDDREKAWQLMLELGLPLALHDPEFRNLNMTRRIQRVADRLGYPVMLKPRARLSGRGLSCRVDDPAGLAVAVGRVQRAGRDVFLEQWIEGLDHRMILAGGQLAGVFDMADHTDVSDRCHPAWKSYTTLVAQAVPAGLIVLSVVTPDIGADPKQAGGAFVDLDPAPQLDSFLPANSALLQSSMDAFVGWLYPSGAPSRVPIVAVTGTNGKTTTSRMIAAMLQACGQSTGLCCSDGLYFNGEELDDPRLKIGERHMNLLDWEPVEAAVLETHFGRLFRGAIAYRWCDVGVCTNVTEDHLGHAGIHTLEQMAVLKRSVVERARHAAILNFDDPHCRRMAPFTAARRIFFVTIEASFEELAGSLPQNGAAVLLETREETEWIVIRDGDLAIPVIAVGDIPATFGGTARFNVSNAVHAVAAAYALDSPVGAMHAALSGFGASWDNTPGRLNLHDNGVFRIIMDYAHNPDGMRRLREFLEHLEVKGRRLLLFAVTTDRTDQVIRDTATAAAGFFDHYACRTYPLDGLGREAHVIIDLLHQALIEAGVPDSAVTCHPIPEEAVGEVLSMAGPDDLVVMTPGTVEFDDMWSKITAFEP